jgi:flagellar FliJ protein
MARRFTFRFDTLLKIRRQREDEHKRIVGGRLREIAQTQLRIDAIQRQIDEEMNAIRAGQDRGTIDIQQLMRHRHWLGHLHKSGLEAEARLGYLEARLAQERAALAEAVKQRRILEKLRERQADRHQREADRQERLESDELATVRYVFERRTKDSSGKDAVVAVAES